MSESKVLQCDLTIRPAGSGPVFEHSRHDKKVVLLGQCCIVTVYCTSVLCLANLNVWFCCECILHHCGC